jgi:hypothetical protein
MIAPINMNGRLLPHGIRELSLMTPTRGATMAPHTGAVIHMSEVWTSEIPR